MNNVQPTSLVDKAKQEYAQGNYSTAAEMFLKAVQAYSAAGDELNAAEMKNNRSVALLQSGKAKDAFQATDGTEAIFQQAGDVKRQGVAVANRAAALEGMKKFKEALEEYDRAASILEQAGEGDMHSMVRKAAANLNLKLGRVSASQMDVLDSLRLAEKPTLTQRIMKFLLRIGIIR